MEGTWFKKRYSSAIKVEESFLIRNKILSFLRNVPRRDDIINIRFKNEFSCISINGFDLTSNSHISDKSPPLIEVKNIQSIYDYIMNFCKNYPGNKILRLQLGNFVKKWSHIDSLRGLARPLTIFPYQSSSWSIERHVSLGLFNIDLPFLYLTD